MSLSAASALPLQREKTDKRKREARMPLSAYFGPKKDDDDDDAKPGELDQPKRTAMGWDTERQPIGNDLQAKTPDKLHAERQFVQFGDTTSSRTMRGIKPPNDDPAKKRMTLGKRIAQKD